MDSRTLGKVLQIVQKNSNRIEKLEKTVNDKMNEVLARLEELKRDEVAGEEKEIAKGRKGKGKSKNEFYKVNIYFIIIFFLFMPFISINNLIYITGYDFKIII